ncbi:MAG: asparagine synthase (glutamine-hydrolyzing) [Phycisphaerae bacterium]|nr:asparagine synthase (glutamine-hydrolyzing) [Phycisphaerae bacterium]
MCGIAGAIRFDGRPLETDRFRAMVEAIAHRGPDDAGYLAFQSGQGAGAGLSCGLLLTDSRFAHLHPQMPVIDSPAGRGELAGGSWDVFLGHRRLSIVDLSARGHQPMTDASGRLWITYNGEIYNFLELREQLEALGHRFISRTDTEVLLAAYRQWGLAMVEKLNGMFAFGLWDADTRQLHIVRDRFGIKPVYVREGDGMLLFASEIKSILAYLPQRTGLDYLALNEYLSFQNILSDRTLFAGIRLLPPATILTVGADGDARTRTYWDFRFRDEDPRPPEEIQEDLAERIRTAVERQCMGDVPIGSYLSGGMDSGTVTMLTARRLGRIFTFTGGFDLSEANQREQRFDERELAEKMSSRFQTEHYECVMHSGDMEAAMFALVHHLEDLRLGQSYPNYYMCRLASRFVKVVLSGAGGDELFGGYPWRYAAAVGPGEEEFVANYYHYWQRLVSNQEKQTLYTSQTAERLRALGTDEFMPFKNHTLNVFRSVLSGLDGPNPDTLTQQVNTSLYFECKTFLHGLLVLDDKLAMAHSLEQRIPFLDNDLVDLACRIPVRYKVAGIEHLERLDENLQRKKSYYQDQMHTGKTVLRAAMEKHLPPEIVAARKQGFSAPDESWFRGRSEQFVRNMLLGDDSRLGELIHRTYIAGVLDAHCTGQKNKRLLIWSLLSLEAWLRIFQPTGTAS